MSRIVAFESVTLDGVMQAPGRPDEDRRGGFEHGGWAAPYADEVTGRAGADSGAETDALLLGRRTYEDFAGFWPKQRDNPFTEILNRARKLVASRSLEEPLPWEHSELLRGDACDAVAAIREAPGRNVVILGSGDLVRSLAGRGLIDQYTLLIHPLVLGSGQRLFDGRGMPSTFELADTKTSTTGVIIATYRQAPGAANGQRPA